MFELGSRRQRAGRLSARLRACTILGAAGAVAILGLAPPPSSGAVDPACPPATDLSTLAEGAPLHGLTVSKGVAPESFTGSLIGIQKDGIVPGVDLIIVELSSPAIDKAGGVWLGMSGSPVYAADGTLVGAVSWGLSYSPSKIVGLTPAGEMRAMLDATKAGASSAVGPRHITLAPRLERALVSSGAEDSATVQAGMRPMPLPLAVSGLSTHRIDQLAKRMSTDGVRPYSAPSVPSAASTGTPVVPGGNLAASWAYGFVSAAATGTATEVCGNEVLGFGHSIGSPRGNLTMHNGAVLYVQPDALGQPYKITNLTGPVGAVPDDLLPGIHGYVGAAPPATQVRSTATVGADQPRTGTTYISLRAALPDYTALNAVAVEDRALGVDMRNWSGAPGSDLVAWKVSGTRADGSAFGYTRTDRFTSAYDIAYSWPWDLYDQLSQLLNNDTENVTVAKVTTTSTTDPVYKRLRIAALEVRSGGAWHPVSQRQPLTVRAGTTQRFRVVMRSAALGTRYQLVDVAVPAKAAGRSGDLSFQGGDDYQVAPPEGATIDQLLRTFSNAPRNDQIIVRLSFGGLQPTHLRVPRAAVVGGSVGVSVQAVR